MKTKHEPIGMVPIVGYLGVWAILTVTPVNVRKLHSNKIFSNIINYEFYEPTILRQTIRVGFGELGIKWESE